MSADRTQGHDPIDLSSLSRVLDQPVVVADVGCRWGAVTGWDHLAPALSILGFDPDVQECARLELVSGGGPTRRFLPYALGAEDGRRLLHVAREPACSSLFPPDPIALAARPELGVIETIRTETVEVKRLDTWASADGCGYIDAMKIDVQGAELDVLTGAGAMLGGMSILELEVTFTPIYSGQALFADVDAFLRQRGFSLWSLRHLVHYGLPGMNQVRCGGDLTWYDGRAVPSATFGGQLYWGHAFYVANSLAQAAPSTPQQGIREAALCAGAGLVDLAHDRLNHVLRASDEPHLVAAASAALRT